RPCQQHTAWHATTQALVLGGLLEIVDDVQQVRLGLLDAGHVLKRGRFVGMLVELGFALAEVEDTLLRLAGPAAHEYKQADEQQPGQEVSRMTSQAAGPSTGLTSIV